MTVITEWSAEAEPLSNTKADIVKTTIYRSLTFADTLSEFLFYSSLEEECGFRVARNIINKFKFFLIFDNDFLTSVDPNMS